MSTSGMNMGGSDDGFDALDLDELEVVTIVVNPDGDIEVDPGSMSQERLTYLLFDVAVGSLTPMCCAHCPGDEEEEEDG